MIKEIDDDDTTLLKYFWLYAAVVGAWKTFLVKLLNSQIKTCIIRGMVYVVVSPI